MLTGLPAIVAMDSPLAHAATRCAPADAQGVQSCTSGVVIGAMETVRQRCPQWCWAACIQAVFSLQGRGTAQEWAVEKIFGSRECLPATSAEIIKAVNGEWRDEYGFRFRAGAEQLPDASLSIQTSVPGTSGTNMATNAAISLFSNDGAKRMVEELDKGNPLIVGALGHATVLTAARYSKHRSGYVALTGLTVRDPWPDNPNRRELTLDEVRNTFFVARVWLEQ